MSFRVGRCHVVLSFTLSIIYIGININDDIIIVREERHTEM